MAKQVLPVNFKDDILASSMGGKRRYNLIQNDDGTYSLEDVTEYTQTGSDFGAGQINATNQAVNESCDKADVIDDLDDIVANQADGMIAGAKAVAQLISNLPEAASYTSGSYNVASDANNWQGTGFPNKIFDDIGLEYVKDDMNYRHAFRVPKAGTYKIDIYMDFSTANTPTGGATMYGRLVKNKTTELSRQSYEINRYQGVSYGFLVQLAANDLVSFELLHTTSGVDYLQLGTRNMFNIIKL